jgi:dihydrofolate reductase
MKIVVFENLSLDGYFQDAAGDMSWAHVDDEEWRSFTESNAESGGPMLMGRKTYEMMKSFWPTPMAKQVMPKVADRMNSADKIVFSRSLKSADWQNTRVESDAIAATRKLREGASAHAVIMGSGEIVAQLVGAGLVDELMLAIHPLVLGRGRTLFANAERSAFAHISTRTFGNGRVVLRYAKP